MGRAAHWLGRLGLAALVPVLVLVPAACSDDDGDAGAAGSATTSAASSTSSRDRSVTTSTSSAVSATPTPPSTTTPTAGVATSAPPTITTPPTTAPPPPAPVPAPTPEGAPACEEAALDAVAAPAEVHLWEDLLCLEGYAHAFLVFEDPAAASPEYVFVAAGKQWSVLVSGGALDGNPALAGMPAEVLAAFQLVGPGGAGAGALPPPPDDGGPAAQPPPSIAAPCEAAPLAAAAGYEPDIPLSGLACAGEYARIQADVGDGVLIDNVFALGSAGWVVLASGLDLSADATVLGLPADVRAALGF